MKLFFALILQPRPSKQLTEYVKSMAASGMDLGAEPPQNVA